MRVVGRLRWVDRQRRPLGAASGWFDFVLARWTLSAHDVAMAITHPFTFKIEADPLSGRRFRWTVCEGDQIRLRSPHSYATRRETEADAAKAMLKLAANQPGRKDWTV
jgi:hypothetical protein